MQITQQQLKLLSVLTEANPTKERLIEAVWGYKYDAFRHDSLLYNAVGKLRKLLGPRSEWLQTTDNGWRWAPQVRLILDLPDPVVIKESAVSWTYSDQLNFRQLKALKIIPTDTGWSVPAYRKAFQVSNMTAFRDLTHLLQLGYLVRVGRGRACRYLPKQV